MYGSRGCTGRPGALDCQNCILPVPARIQFYVNGAPLVNWTREVFYWNTRYFFLNRDLQIAVTLSYV
jgi:hypothetical protein